VTDEKTILTVAVLGGTGQEGAGLAMRWALSGYHVIIGSRDAERAAAKATELNDLLGDEYLSGAQNVRAVEQADLVVLTVPYSAHETILGSARGELQGKTLIDVTVPLDPSDKFTVHLPEGGAAALEAQSFLGDGVVVVAAFQNVSAAHLQDPHHAIACDVLVCGDDPEAKAETLRLVSAAGMRGLDAGPLANAVAIESLSPVLMSIARTYKVRGGTGIHITGIT
jgi:NADPH-dependent F420 reductase